MEDFSSGTRCIPPVLTVPGGVTGDSMCLPESLQLTGRDAMLPPGVVFPLTRLLSERELRDSEFVRTKVEPAPSHKPEIKRKIEEK